MLKFSRRRFSPAFFRGATLASLLAASLVGFVGCSGGANPFCCDSKEKERLDNLERAQSADENAEDDASAKEDAQNSDDETQEKKKDTTFAGLGGTDGSGDAPTLAASAPPAQQVPVTASTGAVAPNALPETTSTPDSVSPADETPSDASALLPAPELASATPTEPSAEPTPAPAPVSEESSADETSATNAESADDAENDAKPVDAPSVPAPSPEQETENAQEKTSDAPETPQPVARAARRNGPQRAVSSRVAQRATPQTVAVPETRGAATVATLSADSNAAPSSTYVVKVRAQTTVPASGASIADASRPEILPSLGAQRPTSVVKIRKRTIIP